MYDTCDNGLYPWLNTFTGNPAVKFLVDGGFDPYNYISTAQLVSSPYTTQPLLVAKMGGLNRLIEAVDDSQPPIGSLNPNNPPNNPAFICYNNVIQSVTTEINGYLSSVYPIPLMQTGTVTVLEITSLTTDGLNGIAGVTVVVGGNYLTTPATAQSPAYLKYIDPLALDWLQANIYGTQNQLRFSGSGFQCTVAYTQQSYADESGQELQTYTVAKTGTPITINTAGSHYQLGQLLVLIGGSSVVPAIIRQATLDIIYYELYKRRFAPDEKNTGTEMARHWRKLLKTIREDGNEPLDGTYKRFYSAATSWNTESVLNGANSL